LGVYSGSEKHQNVCKVPTDAGQHPFSRLGEDKIRGSSYNEEEKDAKDNLRGPPELLTSAGFFRGFRERRIEHGGRGSVCRYPERLIQNRSPGILFLPVPSGKIYRFPDRERPSHLMRCRLFPHGKGYGRFDTTIVGWIQRKG
jgi:hypothetical protein